MLYVLGRLAATALIQQVRPEVVTLEKFLGKFCMLTAEEILFIPEY